MISSFSESETPPGPQCRDAPLRSPRQHMVLIHIAAAHANLPTPGCDLRWPKHRDFVPQLLSILVNE